MTNSKRLFRKLKDTVIGTARNPKDKALFHSLSLIAFYAWVGLGADGISSSCYGPEESFLALGSHHYLGIFVAIASAFTIFVISASYNQVIELFPSGGGGYLIASQLLGEKVGVVSGCALLIDYVLTITLSIASGADAIFSFLPKEFLQYKLYFAFFGLFVISILNLRGVKESVAPLIPIFLVFIITHIVLIGISFFTHISDLKNVSMNVSNELSSSVQTLGLFGTFILIMKAYSMGAGTYTGIEAVSNGMPILREPKVLTAKKTMNYMTISLALMVGGLTVSYLLFGVQHVPGKTLNAVLFEAITINWGTFGYIFVLITLISEALLLFVAAQTGFLGGPRVLSNMALDGWMPKKFTMLSDRFVTHNGIIIMSTSAFLLMLFTGGSVKIMVVLYAINVFITFALSQLGLVKKWWTEKHIYIKWKKKLLVSGVGLVLTMFILIMVTILKFEDGGWVTILITSSVFIFSLLIKKHYNNTNKLLKRLDDLVELALTSINELPAETEMPPVKFDSNGKTAVLLTNGFNGLGLHTLFGVMRLFQNSFKNFIFIHVGAIDAGNFKGTEQIEHLDKYTKNEGEKWVKFVNSQGFYGESITAISHDIIEQVDHLQKEVSKKYPGCVFFGGQLVFPEETFLTRWLHNNIVFSIQRKFYHQGIPLIILPIRVYA